MSQDKQPAKSRKKPIADVDKPGDSAPAATSKPVIVTNRPILKDPMVVDEAAKTDDDGKKIDEKTELKHSTAPVIQPLDKSASEPEDQPDEPPKPAAPPEEPKVKDKPPADEAAPEPKPASEPVPKTDDKQTTAKATKQKSDAETAEQAKHEAAIQHLIDSKKYELPINAVEKRKSKHFAVLGIVLAVLLVLAWGDIAADAGIIHISGLKPATHFFSN
jgi:hypothetical protein